MLGADPPDAGIPTWGVGAGQATKVISELLV
jgi:hypothetical protein